MLFRHGKPQQPGERGGAGLLGRKSVPDLPRWKLVARLVDDEQHVESAANAWLRQLLSRSCKSSAIPVLSAYRTVRAIDANGTLRHLTAHLAVLIHDENESHEHKKDLWELHTRPRRALVGRGGKQF